MENANGQDAPGNPGPGSYSPDAVLARIKNNTREAASPPLQIPGWVVPAVLALIVVALWYGYNNLGKVDIPLCVINTSSDLPLDIRLDGKSVGKASRMIGEDPKAVIMTVLKLGKHELEARDSSGKVVAGEKLLVEEGSKGFLWTPLADPSFKFVVQTTYYGEEAGKEYFSRLEGYGPLWTLPEWVSHWFQDNPKTVSVPKGWKSTHERALRRAANAR